MCHLYSRRVSSILRRTKTHGQGVKAYLGTYRQIVLCKVDLSVSACCIHKICNCILILCRYDKGSYGLEPFRTIIRKFLSVVAEKALGVESNRSDPEAGAANQVAVIMVFVKSLCSFLAAPQVKQILYGKSLAAR